jgi:hypothetical protein
MGPAPTALHARDDHRWVKLELHRWRIRVGTVLAGIALCLALTLEPLLGVAQRRATALGRPQLLRQLIATPIPIELILFTIDSVRLSDDVPRDLLEVTV